MTEPAGSAEHERAPSSGPDPASPIDPDLAPSSEPDPTPPSEFDPVASFTRHRSLLFTVAYEITGSATDAEDVVQDSYLRWAKADRAEVRNARAYLVQIATRLALNKLRAAARLREDYVGPWLPEPLLTRPDIADDVVLSESVSMAMLVVLESLSPEERATFVLREVFGLGHDEIAEAVGKSVAAVRQLAHRAREHVHARRPRFATDPRTAEEVVQRFLAATLTGDLQQLMDALAPNAVLLTDGGGIKQAALRPITGADKVSRFLVGVVAKGGAGGRYELAVVNGMPAALGYLDGELDTVALLQLDGAVVTGIYLVRNPDKLARLEHGVDLSRSS